MAPAHHGACLEIRRQSALLSFHQVSPGIKLSVRPVASAFTHRPISLAKTTLKLFLRSVFFKTAILCQNHKQTILRIYIVWGYSSVARVFAQRSWSSRGSVSSSVQNWGWWWKPIIPAQEEKLKVVLSYTESTRQKWSHQKPLSTGGTTPGGEHLSYMHWEDVSILPKDLRTHSQSWHFLWRKLAHLLRWDSGTWGLHCWWRRAQKSVPLSHRCLWLST